MHALFLALLAAPALAVWRGDFKAVASEDAFTQKPLMAELMQMKLAERVECIAEGMCPTFAPMANVTQCINGKAGVYPCKNMDMLSFIPHKEMGTANSNGNDIWGWTDPVTGREIAIVCQTDGTAFVDITNPTAPTILGRLPSNSPGQVVWRDAKVYKDHAFIVSEGVNHGVQVFDLRRLRSERGQFAADALYLEHGSSHNIAINEETGYAYSVGSKTCNGGLHIINIQNPKKPTFEGCFAADGYTHDAQSVIYRGPDSRYFGREIVAAYNEDSLTIVDVTDKKNLVMVSRTPYIGSAYTHQGWFTADFRHILSDDELDEQKATVGPTGRKNDGHTQTYIWNVESLDNPVLVGTYYSPAVSIDHNLYIKKTETKRVASGVAEYAYLANYGSGLRVVWLKDMAKAQMEEVGYFDVRPEGDKVEFKGSWSSYIYFGSRNIVVNSIERGLFVVRPNAEL